LGFVQAVEALGTANSIEIQSVVVDGKTEPLRQHGSLNIGAFPRSIAFTFSPATNSTQSPMRIRYKLDGYNNKWNEGGGEMYLSVRFYNELGDQIGQKQFFIAGESPDWTGSLKTSHMIHRRETVIVPALASRIWIAISSGGPPDTVGIYAVANLQVSKVSSNLPPSLLIQSPFDHRPSNNETSDQTPPGWTQDGFSPSMAKIVRLGSNPATEAFAILDDSLIGHADWHTTKESAPEVSPGDQLEVEWNEMYSMGIGSLRVARYENLPTGTYHFHIESLDIMGVPTGAEASLTVFVPPPYWKTSWFWGGLLIVCISIIAVISRYLIWNRVQREMLQLKNQQALEHERLRIAHDIHDDLGARVTQISLLSAMSKDKSIYPEDARVDFDQISQMSRELVAALYQTVWAVNPENDNLDALGNYICQMVNRLCERTQVRCRFHVAELPREIEISSQTRHNISMAVKEAVHNVIKHAKAVEVTITVKFTGNLLTVVIQDNGCGFNFDNNSGGNGLINMKRRLQDIGGSCFIESASGRGTTVSMKLTVTPSNKNQNHKVL
jgi:signal transduction histidine kinase